MNAMTEQEKLTSQWITSLAISVICCAALFLVFAGYIIDLHGKTADTAIRLEILQERQNQLVAELDAIRRPIPVMATNPAYQQTRQTTPENATAPLTETAPQANPDAASPSQPAAEAQPDQPEAPENANAPAQVVPPKALAAPPKNPINPVKPSSPKK